VPFVFLQTLIFTPKLHVAMNDISAPEQYDLQTASLKVPPHSIEAEQAVLGGLMLDNNAWARVLAQVSDGDLSACPSPDFPRHRQAGRPELTD